MQAIGSAEKSCSPETVECRFQNFHSLSDEKNNQSTGARPSLESRKISSNIEMNQTRGTYQHHQQGSDYRKL